MEAGLRDGMLLMKEYCGAHGLRPTADKDLLEPWETVCGPIVAGAFLEEDMPPIVWVDLKGNIWINQDESLLDDTEPATAIIGPDLLRVSINTKKPIHPVQP